MMQSKIARHQNSLIVLLPAALARNLNFREGDSVVLRRTGHGVAVEHPSARRLTAWLQTVREVEPEVCGRTAVGREVSK